MNALFHAIAFLTRLPVPRLSAETKDWERSPAFYPVVGLLLGLLLAAWSWLMQQVFPASLAAVLTLTFWVFITGGLHLDGWMDLADGLGSWRDREKVFAIMKDSRVGAMGVIAAILLFMVKGVALYEIASSGWIMMLVLPPLLARTMLVAAIWFWPYVTEKGLGSGLRSGLTRTIVTIGLCGTAVAIIGVYQLRGLFVVGLSVVLAVLFTQRIHQRLGGLTGDCYGALVEWTEACALIAIVAAGRFV